MSNILIINLKRSGDIFSSANNIAALKKQNPHSKITMLVYKQFKKAAAILDGVDIVKTIDKHRVETISNSKLYSDILAFDYLHSALEFTRNTSWDSIINYSNDKISTYLTSAIYSKNKSKVQGIYFNKQNILQYSDRWAIVFNDILTSYKYTPLHYNDVQRQILRTNTYKNQTIKTLKKHDKIASDSFMQIRSSESSITKHDVKLVGIQIFASSEEKSLNKDLAKELINELLDRPEYLPVILFAPIDSERRYVEQLNKEFDESLVSVESDFIALPSVLKNMDLLVSVDTSVKHLANAVNTKVLEISLGSGPFLKQGTHGENDYILTNSFSDRFVDNHPVVGLSAINIMSCLDYIFNLNTSVNIPGDLCFYATFKDVLGVNYKMLHGNDIKSEYKRLIARQFLSKLLLDKFDSSIYSSITDANKKSYLLPLIENDKVAIAEISRILLATIRSLLLINDQENAKEKFSKNFQKILGFCENSELATVPCLFFRAEIESISTTSLAENMKTVEEKLYTLKSNLQICLMTIKNLEELIVNDNYKLSKIPTHITATEI